jgi:hypothetical protein
VPRTVPGVADALSFNLIDAGEEISRLGHCPDRYVCEWDRPRKVPVSNDWISVKSMRRRWISAMHSQLVSRL